jgi:hypothetical protein
MGAGPERVGTDLDRLKAYAEKKEAAYGLDFTWEVDPYTGWTTRYRMYYTSKDTGRRNKGRYYSVRRDRTNRSDRWGVFDGDVLAWNGEQWDHTSSQPESFKWSQEDALEIAERLAVQRNQVIIGSMESRFPGQFRGGEHDLLARA